jgi:hypothetical protein
MRVFGMDMYTFIVGMVISWTILTGFLNAELRHTLIDRYPPPSFSHTEEDTRLLLIESFIWSGAASLIWPITLPSFGVFFLLVTSNGWTLDRSAISDKALKNSTANGCDLELDRE